MDTDQNAGGSKPWSAHMEGMKLDLHIIARMLQLLTDMRGRRGLDAENLHILCAFGLADLAHRSRTADTPAQEFESQLSASAVSEMTFIPRQTVRRRLERLCLLHYLTHLGDGRYTAGARFLELDLPAQLRRIYPSTT